MSINILYSFLISYHRYTIFITQTPYHHVQTFSIQEILLLEPIFLSTLPCMMLLQEAIKVIIGTSLLFVMWSVKYIPIQHFTVDPHLKSFDSLFHILRNSHFINRDVLCFCMSRIHLSMIPLTPIVVLINPPKPGPPQRAVELVVPV